MRYLACSERFFLDSPGGSYRVAWELARSLRDEGHDAALLCGSTDRDPPPGAVEVDGVQVVRYRFPSTWAANPLRASLHRAAARTAAEPLVGNARWDVVHAHAPVLALALFPRVRNGARLVYTMHSPAVLEDRIKWASEGVPGRVKLLLGMPLLRREESDALERADVVHVLSDYTRRQIERLYSSASAKTVCLPWWAPRSDGGVEKLEARRRLRLPERSQVLFTLRRMVPRMGLDLLLEAAEGLAHHFEFTLVLAGDGPQRPELEARAARGPLAGRVRFTGRLSEEEIGWAYEACDAFVLPTRELECFGIIVLEALAHDRPILGSNAGAIPELLGPVLRDWLFEAGDVDALRAALAKFLSGALKRPPAGFLSRHVRERFGREKLLARYHALLGCPRA
jgi:glycosyltransferase involved in cell wall biosynthesis